jgi:hypothetical protein
MNSKQTREIPKKTTRPQPGVMSKNITQKTNQPHLSVKPKKLAEKRISFNKLIPFTLWKLQNLVLASAFKITAQKFLPFQKNEYEYPRTF